MTRFIHETGLTGWYYRVIEEGTAGPGCEFSLLERDASEVTVERLQTLYRAHRPLPESLESIAAVTALSANWVEKLKARAQQLRLSS